jgi:hypothetical protein
MRRPAKPDKLRVGQVWWNGHITAWAIIYAFDEKGWARVWYFHPARSGGGTWRRHRWKGIPVTDWFCHIDPQEDS